MAESRLACFPTSCFPKPPIACSDLCPPWVSSSLRTHVPSPAGSCCRARCGTASTSSRCCTRGRSCRPPPASRCCSAASCAASWAALSAGAGTRVSAHRARRAMGKDWRGGEGGSVQTDPIPALLLHCLCPTLLPALPCPVPCRIAHQERQPAAAPGAAPCRRPPSANGCVPAGAAGVEPGRQPGIAGRGGRPRNLAQACCVCVIECVHSGVREVLHTSAADSLPDLHSCWCCRARRCRRRRCDSAFCLSQDDALAFEVGLAVKGDVTVAVWFTDHFAEVGGGNGMCVAVGCTGIPNRTAVP